MRSSTASSLWARWGKSRRKSSTRGRAPDCHASRCRSSTATRVVSLIAFLQPELLAQPGQGAVQLLSQGGGIAAHLRGDARPVVALVAQLDEAQFLGTEP